MLNSSITTIKGIGPRRAEAFGRLGLFTLGDIIRNFPRRYIDYSKPKLIREAENGESAAIKATVISAPKNVRLRNALTMTAVGASDGLSKFQLVWFNQPYSAGKLSVGDTVFACGRVDKTHGLKLINPAIYNALPGIVPIYAQSNGLNQKLIRESVLAALDMCLDYIEESLSLDMLAKYQLMPIKKAYLTLHKPENEAELNKAKDRLAFEDMLLYSTMIEIIKLGRRQQGGIAFDIMGLKEQYTKLLPFTLTNAQLSTIDDIALDMAKHCQMNRLIQGDVGSGKTACAMFAIYAAIKNGRSAAIVAPTEILADQHHKNLIKLFGEENTLLIKGSMKKSERTAAQKLLLSNKPFAIAATHAIISDGVEIPNLGLVVADEQHRFGVRQRAAMAAKGKDAPPDMLIMSATPIPRTLSLLMYGDLDLSVINQLPPGRKPITTRIVPKQKRADMYRFVCDRLKSGLQAYAVCPMIDESEEMDGVLSAVDLYKELNKTLDVKVELMHGKLKPIEKAAVAKRFIQGETQLLVSTTVIEVGIDVPNAAIMIIENADRFGLAQLHQLRGRVGRGSAESYCFLLSEADSQGAKDRLKALCDTADGFEIAQKDLMLRGPGEMLGERQHGEDIFSAARFLSNIRVFELAKQASLDIINNGDENDPVYIRAKEIAELKQKTVANN